MKNATHRVVILKNLNSDLISQAIIFLKDVPTASETRIIEEAEKIVAKYMTNCNLSETNFTKKRRFFNKKILFSVTAGVLVLGITTAVFILL